LESPELLPGSFVDEALAQHHSDLLFGSPLKTGWSGPRYILLEHKSSQDSGTPYTAALYRAYLDEVVIRRTNNFLAGWVPWWLTKASRLDALNGIHRLVTARVPESLRPYLISFRHALVV